MEKQRKEMVNGRDAALLIAVTQPSNERNI